MAAPASQKQYLLILTVLGALLIFPGLGRRGLAGYDDAYHAHEGREMVTSGDWGSVRFNGQFSFDYLPMFCWMEATSFEIFGKNDFAARFPSALLGLATILLLYFVTLELTGEAWLSLLAMMVLLTTQFFLKNAAHAMTDVPFTFFFTLAMFVYLKALKNEKPVYLILLGLPVGAALLMRSVIGLLPLGVIFVHLLLTKRYKLLFSPSLALGTLIVLSLPFAWVALQVHRHGPMALAMHLQFIRGKAQAGEATRQWSTLLNYPVALLKYYWPWLPFLVVGLVQATRAALARHDEIAIFLIAWVLLVLVPLSLVHTRYPRYIMAAFPAFSILSAWALDRWLPEARREMFFKGACIVVCLAIVLTFTFPPKPRAADILALAPVADANTPAGNRVLFYTFEPKRDDFEWQYLWYGNRYTELAPTLAALALRLTQENSATGVVDKASYEQLRAQLPREKSQELRVLARSENLVCFRLG